MILETCEELSSANYVMRVMRALGERGILARVQGVLMAHPKAWNFEQQFSDEQKIEYKRAQREVVLHTVRRYNPTAPVVQNLDFGHTAPTLCIPYGGEVEIKSDSRSITVEY